MPKLTHTDDELALSLSGAGDFNTALNMARSITPRRFDADRKLWIYPRDPDIAEQILLTVQPTADQSLLAWVQASKAEREEALSTSLPDDDTQLFIPWSYKLFDFQRASVGFLAAHPKAILADDMGLGKTLQALSAVAEFLIRNSDIDTKLPRLVVCPNSAKGVWGREIEKWLGDQEPFVLVDAKTPKKRLEQIEGGIANAAWVVVNYEQIRAHKVERKRTINHQDGSVSERVETSWPLKQSVFTDTKWLAVVADEAHRVKSRNAAQTRGLWQIEAPMKLALTGTPLMNNPAELWSLLRWLYPEQYNSNGSRQNPKTAYWTFHDQYTKFYEGYKGSKIVVGVKNPDALRFELKDRLIRRTKGEKLNIPEKLRESVPVALNTGQRKVYEDAETKFWLEIEQAVKEGDQHARNFAADVLSGRRKIYEIPNGAARTVRLRQIACSPALLGGDDDSAKLDAIVEKILDNQHQQHVVFSEFVMGANLLVERLTKKGIVAEAFTGEVKDTRVRTYFEDRFQSGHIQVLVGTLAAMRESITLTAASTVHFCERAWVPGWNEQAEDRLHRTGQKNQVLVLIYEAEDTVDTQKVRPTLYLKENIVASVIKKDAIQEKEAV